MSAVSSNVQSQTIGRARKSVFYAAAGLFVALLVALYGFVIGILEFPITGWFKANVLTIHQLHDTVGVLLIYALLTGMISQVWRTEKQVGAMQQAAVLMTLIIVTMLVAGMFEPPLLIFLALIVTAAALHPARGQLLNVRRVDPYLLALTAVAAIPLVDYSVDHLRLQLTAGAADTHAAFGHYAIMAAYAFAIVLLGVLAALRPSGWRVPTYSAALMAIHLGVASLVMVDQSSGIGALWGTLAILWGMAFAVVAEWRSRQEV